MQKVELMEVQDTFDIKNVGVLVVPSFSLPSQRKWQPLIELVAIKDPSGQYIEVEAPFSVIHLNRPLAKVGFFQNW